MSKVRAKNTSPERILRSGLHRAGFRYSLHKKGLPGSPDLVFTSRRKVIFVHGCFWHGHQGCNQGRIPASNEEYWREKISANKIRDQNSVNALTEQGWSVHTVWGCSLRSQRKIEETIHRAIEFLKG